MLEPQGRVARSSGANRRRVGMASGSIEQDDRPHPLIADRESCPARRVGGVLARQHAGRGPNKSSKKIYSGFGTCRFNNGFVSYLTDAAFPLLQKRNRMFLTCNPSLMERTAPTARSQWARFDATRRNPIGEQHGHQCGMGRTSRALDRVPIPAFNPPPPV